MMSATLAASSCTSLSFTASPHLGESPSTTLDCVAKNLQALAMIEALTCSLNSIAVSVQAWRKGTLRCRGASHKAGGNLFRMFLVACKLAERSALAEAIFANSLLSNSPMGATQRRCTDTSKHTVALMASSAESRSETTMCGKVVGETLQPVMSTLT